jgi:hypothetical protein
MTMFGLPKNPSAELWDGPRTGLDGMMQKFGADEVFYHVDERLTDCQFQLN